GSGTLQLGAGSSGGSERLLLGGTLNVTGATVSWNGEITLNANGAVIRVDSSNSDSLTLNGRIDGGTNGLIKLGLGTLGFAGTSPNTYTGRTQVIGGILDLAKPSGTNAIGGSLLIDSFEGASGRAIWLSDNQIPDDAVVTIRNGGILDLGSFGRSD